MTLLRKYPYTLIFLVLFTAFSAYSFLVYSDGTPGKAVSEASRRGQLVWQKYNCQACHQFYGLGGHKGPDLTNVISEPYKGAAYVLAIVQNGAGQMPAFEMEVRELEDLIVFLTEMDQSGRSRVDPSSIDRWGNYHPRKPADE